MNVVVLARRVLKFSAVVRASETVDCSQAVAGLEIACSQGMYCKISKFQTRKDRLKTLVARNSKK